MHDFRAQLEGTGSRSEIWNEKLYINVIKTVQGVGQRGVKGLLSYICSMSTSMSTSSMSISGWAVHAIRGLLFRLVLGLSMSHMMLKSQH